MAGVVLFHRTGFSSRVLKGLTTVGEAEGTGEVSWRFFSFNGGTGLSSGGGFGEEISSPTLFSTFGPVFRPDMVVPSGLMCSFNEPHTVHSRCARPFPSEHGHTHLFLPGYLQMAWVSQIALLLRSKQQDMNGRNFTEAEKDKEIRGESYRVGDQERAGTGECTKESVNGVARQRAEKVSPFLLPVSFQPPSSQHVLLRKMLFKSLSLLVLILGFSLAWPGYGRNRREEQQDLPERLARVTKSPLVEVMGCRKVPPIHVFRELNAVCEDCFQLFREQELYHMCR